MLKLIYVVAGQNILPNSGKNIPLDNNFAEFGQKCSIILINSVTFCPPIHPFFLRKKLKRTSFRTIKTVINLFKKIIVA